MFRIGESVKKDIKYHYRPGIYGIIIVNNNILLTEQNEEEIQLPGGGIDKGEHYITALVRETFEETGWKIQPVKRLGFFHRFVYMPEYSKWAQKVCHIYICKGLYNLTSPLEKGHKAVLMKPREAVCLLESPGDRFFVKNYFGLKANLRC